MVQKGPIIYSDLVHGMSWSRIKLVRCHPKDFGTNGNWRTQYRLQSCGTHFFMSPGSSLLLPHKVMNNIWVRGDEASYLYGIIGRCTDFTKEENIHKSHCKSMGVECDRSTKFHPEVAGEGIEYIWGNAKMFFRRIPLNNRKGVS